MKSERDVYKAQALEATTMVRGMQANTAKLKQQCKRAEDTLRILRYHTLRILRYTQVPTVICTCTNTNYT